jgi:DNA polymerase III epsilon subunit-like protein
MQCSFEHYGSCGDGPENRERMVDVYFSADIETDGPIPGPYSMLSVALVYAGRFDGERFHAPENHDCAIYRELAPISDDFEAEALAVNGLDRERLIREGEAPAKAMQALDTWVRDVAGAAKPVLVAYPLSFDWTWLYWYFIKYCNRSPFGHSQCFDIKTAIATKHHLPISQAGRSKLPARYETRQRHTHHALDDAIAQAEIFAKLFEADDESSGNRKAQGVYEG